MKSNIYQIKEYKNSHEKNINIAENIFIEMENLGIDPKPFLEMAALDLYNQYGNDALHFADRIYQNFFDLGDVQSSRIWRKLINILMLIDQKTDLIAH